MNNIPVFPTIMNLYILKKSELRININEPSSIMIINVILLVYEKHIKIKIDTK